MNLPAAIAALNAQTAELAARLESWANISSGSGNFAGLQRMLEVLREAFAGFNGAKIETLALPGTAVKALSVCMRPDAKVRILMSGHYDTVYDKEHPFQSCTRPDEYTLRGPGVADMKGGIVTMLAALQAFELTPSATNIGWEVLLTPDEETGSYASVEVITQTARRCTFGLVFEPARVSGDLVRSRKGTGIFTLTCHGRAAHAAQAAAGRNAIVALAALVQEANRLPDQLPGVLLNVGHFIGGGSATNIVPNHATAVLDVRMTKASDQASIVLRMRELVAKANEADGFHIELKSDVNRPPKESCAVEEWVFAKWLAAAESLHVPAFSWVHSGGGSDGNILSAAGLPNLDGVGPIGDQLHSDDEYCVLPSIAQRAQIVALFLHRLASGEITLTPSPQA